MIYSNGHSVALSPLRERLPQIAEVIRLYRNGVESQLIPPEHPFSLIGKGFYPKVRTRDDLLIPQLLSPFAGANTGTSQAHQINSNRAHVRGTCLASPLTHPRYKDNRRCHYTDGLIFTPSDEPYSARGTPTLYKVFPYSCPSSSPYWSNSGSTLIASPSTLSWLLKEINFNSLAVAIAMVSRFAVVLVIFI